MLGSGQYPLDQSVNKTPSHLKEKHKIERERGDERETDREEWIDKMGRLQGKQRNGGF